MDLRQLRISRQKTLAEVAAVVGLDASGLSRVERGEQAVDPDTAKRIADYYCTSMETVYMPYITRQRAT